MESAVLIRRNRPSVERLLQVYCLYHEKGTLQSVGEEIGLSRERVRQLLMKGMERGLFEYRPFRERSREASVLREAILEDYERLLTLKGVAQANGMPVYRLHRLLDQFRIADRDLEKRKIAGRKRICIERYGSAVRSLGHHPTTTELQWFGSTRYLYAQIRRLWGSIEAFRRECGISGSLQFRAKPRRKAASPVLISPGSIFKSVCPSGIVSSGDFRQNVTGLNYEVRKSDDRTSILV